MDTTVSAADSMAAALIYGQSQREAVANAALSRGMTAFQDKRYDRALASFKLAIAYKPDLLSAQRYIGMTFSRMGRTEEAIRAYKQAIRIDPSSLDAQTDLAKYYMTNERYADAEKAYQQIAMSNPGLPGPPASLGYIYMTTGRYAEAEEQFRKAIGLAPKDAAGYYSLGLLYNKENRYSEAVREFKKAIALRPDYAMAHADLANAYIGLDQTEMAQSEVGILRSLNTAESNTLANEITVTMFKPRITSEDIAHSTFNALYGPQTPLSWLDPSLETPGASKTFVLAINFNQAMSTTSVQNVLNWSITRATGGTGGVYNNGANLDPTREVGISPTPLSVTYDPVNHRALVYFRVTQNAAGDGVMDPSHWVFRFKGTDVNGNPIDPHNDQYDGSAMRSF